MTQQKLAAFSLKGRDQAQWTGGIFSSFPNTLGEWSHSLRTETRRQIPHLPRAVWSRLLHLCWPLRNEEHRKQFCLLPSPTPIEFADYCSRPRVFEVFAHEIRGCREWNHFLQLPSSWFHSRDRILSIFKSLANSWHWPLKNDLSSKTKTQNNNPVTELTKSNKGN